MKRILIAAAATLTFAGAAAAQQAPFLQGDYSANVLDRFNGAASVDRMTTSSVAPDMGDGMAPRERGPIVWDDNYGR
ncbi:hypothetical protein N1F89_03710 [Aquibium sp. A9E412]|uniref:hypothetical protein n=1 Tax=Aquibium sp. A9E412 TaxID=2976767 RepID=UPI0025B18EEB|nr:hypothetical protein [Aquibium sp. A9E412]MDN2565317.1 hypothetical protein [Aquibium sp. A9E412]